jgi:hypothetical protein
MGYMWFGVVAELFMPGSRPFTKVFSFFFFSFLIYLLVRSSFLNKKYNFTITVDYDGIRINDNKFNWTAIDEIYIMSQREGKRTNYYLLILKKDATIEKFDLLGFRISSRKLSTIIEYYRTGQKIS